MIDYGAWVIMTLSVFGELTYLIAFYGKQPETCLTTEASQNAKKASSLYIYSED